MKHYKKREREKKNPIEIWARDEEISVKRKRWHATKKKKKDQGVNAYYIYFWDVNKIYQINAIIIHVQAKNKRTISLTEKKTTEMKKKKPHNLESIPDDDILNKHTRKYDFVWNAFWLKTVDFYHI